MSRSSSFLQPLHHKMTLVTPRRFALNIASILIAFVVEKLIICVYDLLMAPQESTQVPQSNDLFKTLNNVFRGTFVYYFSG